MHPRLCLVHQSLAPFVAVDLEILSERYDVCPFEFQRRSDLLRLAGHVRRSRITLSWFALGHATAAVMLSNLFRVPSVVIVGGWDVASMPEIPYGAMLDATRRKKTAWTLRNADLVLAPSNAARSESLRWVDRDVRVVPLGIDTGFLVPSGRKENLVVTAASISHRAVIKTKGLDMFLEVARILPQTEFAVAGHQSAELGAELRAMAPPNVRFTGWLQRDQLRQLFQRASVYGQLSAHESFGVSLAEAMACGCTPVVSDRGALPEVVGRAGSVVPYGDASAAASAVARGIAAGGSSEARTRIEEAFPLERRRQTLLSLVGELA